MILNNKIVLPEQNRAEIEDCFIKLGLEVYLEGIYWVEFRRGIGDT